MKKKYIVPEIVEIQIVIEPFMSSSTPNLFSNKVGVSQGEEKSTFSESSFWNTRNDKGSLE